ncbi:MAG: sugar kinase [Firmicutes bacterium]|nr:sugar kinase [Bacillota bacterium]
MCEKKYIAAFDIGTTAVKGVLACEDGTLTASRSIDIPTIFEGDRKEQDPRVWYDAFCEISRGFFREGETGCGAVTPDGIMGIVMSGQMQDVIPVDEEFQPVGNAILYSDGRGEPQAQRLLERFGAEEIERITGNHCDGSLSFPKILWMKENQPELFSRVSKILISSKDYVIARLTGEAAGDVTACATACAMDIHKKVWDRTMIEEMGISMDLFPKLYHSHQQVGTVTEDAAAHSGYATGTPVYAGVGDAGATTLASGIAQPGQYNINLGTSGWVATVSDDVLPAQMGVFNLAAMPENVYINVVPFLNAGNVHKWISGVLSPEEGRTDYDYINGLLERSSVGAGGVMFLPYLVGERFPVMDNNVKGCFVGLTPETDRKDLVRACLEGVAFSIRQGIESIGTPASSVSVIGGGGRVKVWCQILADVLHQTVYVYKNAEVLPSLAIASAVLLDQGKIESYDDFTASLQKPENSVAYRPSEEAGEMYDRIYRRYLNIYPAVKEL